jgi:D-3-phosphoglycerate dehydrogenase
MMICCARYLHTHNARIREQGFEGRSEFGGTELGRSTVGIVGLGLIGGAVAEYVRPFGADVIAYDPYVSEERAAELGADLVGLEELLETADFVSVHVPLTPETEGMLGEEHFRMMKETAFFVNAARGKLYSDADLARAIEEGWIAGAAIDVFEDEPDILDNPLLGLDEGDALLLPHVLGMTDGATERTREIVVDAIVSVADGEFPPNIVNPEVYADHVPESRLSPGH